MNRIIMLEGCDRTGKSTFINYLEDKLRNKGYIPIIFHLMGPTKFQGFQFNNDDKSLIQLSKFNDEYDLILTGDLSTYGSSCFRKMAEAYGIKLGNNYFDSGLMLYDLEKQDVHAGGSGCGCVSLVTLGYVVKQMYENKLKKVLVIATGALMNPIMVAQKENIPSIAHAIVLERVV